MSAFRRFYHSNSPGTFQARRLALTLMLVASFFQPFAAFAGLHPQTCHELFVADETAALDATVKKLLEQDNINTNRRVYKNFLRNLSRQDKIGRAEVAWLANRASGDKIKANWLRRWAHSTRPSVLMDRYFREEVLKHGYLETLEKASLLRDSTSKDKFRLFLRQYDIVFLVESLIFTIPVAAVHGPVSFSVGLSLAGTPLPWLSAKPIPRELLNEAIEKGIPAVRPQLEEIYGTRARVEAVQRVLEIAVWFLFFASAATFIDEYFPWIRFAVLSALHMPTEEEIQRVHQKLGLELRVDIQVESWANAYREFHGYEPSQSERDRKRLEFRDVLDK